MRKKAEIKFSKVGEPLTDNADGNTEPSILDSSSKACVETRRRVCIKCGNLIPQTKYKSAKYCSNKCRSSSATSRHRLKYSLVEKPGVGSGGNQEAERNHQYKGGVASYNKKAFKSYPHKCNRCGSLDRLEVHHKDHNRKNNDLSNLEILCKRCHKNHHIVRDKFGKFTKV